MLVPLTTPPVASTGAVSRDCFANRLDATVLEHIGEGAGDDRCCAAEPVDTRNRRRSHPNGTRERSVLDPSGRRRCTSRISNGIPTAAPIRDERRTGSLAGAMPGGDCTDQPEQPDADDRCHLPAHGEVTDDQRSDREDGDDADSQCCLVVRAEPLNGQVLQPGRDSVDELTAHRADRRGDIDDLCNEHPDRDRNGSGDQSGERTVERRRRRGPAFRRTRAEPSPSVG
jgi:hypothetical protein